MHLNIKLKRDETLYKFIDYYPEFDMAIVEDEAGNRLEISEDDVDFT
ncbi:hypothetical protein [Bacillus sp. FSL M8-0350]